MELALLALLLLAVAIVLLRLARRGRIASGLPQGRVVYVDSRAWQRPPEPLRASSYGLAGRPDYLVRQGRMLIPVETKPSRDAEEPYSADVLQLAAYCLLVEEAHGRAPPHGLLVYRSRTFEIPFAAGLRRALLETLADMRRAAQQRDVPRNHDDPPRCAACGMRGHCGREALDG
jgi:CRISPR-associated exonuclease Cas4